MAVERRVRSGDVSLSVTETGDPERPTVVLVHGYPDTSGVWDEVVERLEPRYHVVAYDVRGAGASDAPRGPGAYKIERLLEDLRAVIDATSPDRQVHLVCHDFGSFQGWDAVSTPELAGRIASFTSISGPSLDHLGLYLRGALRNPSRLVTVLTQAPRSWYMAAFRVPGLPTLMWTLGARRFARSTRRLGFEARPRHPAKTLMRDGIQGAALYRQNVRARLLRPRQSHTDIPVQVIDPTRDPFVAKGLLDGMHQRAEAFWQRSVRAGHWVQRSHPDLVARWIGEFVDHIEGEPESRALKRARVTGKRRPLEGRLVVITGAGSGIGRATALAFAERGADVVTADVNLTSATRTAELAGMLGENGHPYEVDVSDAQAMERFAKTIEHDLGVPDVVVNNAGIGIAGPFLSHRTEDWQRILDVNLWGVIHGSRLFGQQMVERGEGGHIVNVASAAAFFPSRTLPAYSTSKAAVLMLSECLRAELVHEGIGVSAICPGLINTSIYRTSKFVGAERDEQARRRRAASRLYQLRNFTPERVASEIVRAVRQNLAVVPVAPEAKALRVVSRLSPAVTRFLAKIDVTPR